MILVSLSSLNLEFLTYPPAPITHQTQGSLGSNPTALSHQCHFTSSAWSFHWSEFSPSLWFHVIVCTCCCSWHSAPCNRNCLHVPSPKYPAPLLCLPQFTPTAPAVCLGTWSPWPLPQVMQEGPRRSGAQWWWLPGRSVLLFRAVCQPWAMCRRSTRSELYVCLTTYFKRKTMKNDHERASYRLSRQPSVYCGSAVHAPPVSMHLKYGLQLLHWISAKGMPGKYAQHLPDTSHLEILMRWERAGKGKYETEILKLEVIDGYDHLHTDNRCSETPLM